jgi:hydrogenase maturation protease
VTAPLLVFGWGNASRGDDALGPLFIERLGALAAADADAIDRVEFLDDYQLQVEHALDLVGRERVLFVDASLTCSAPYEVTTLAPARDTTFTTHAMSPSSVMQVYRDLHHSEPPPCTLLAISGTQFELGEPPSQSALDNLAAALDWAGQWLDLGQP